MTKRSLILMGALVTALALLAPPAFGSPLSVFVQSPDEEDFLDLVPWPDPIDLPGALDVGLIHEQVENAIPDVIDEWADVSVGACTLSASAPSLIGIRVVGSATYSCGSPQRVANVTLCLQRRIADRWEPIPESCRTAVSAGQSSTTKRTSAACAPGTWRYRVYPIGLAVGGNPSFAAKAGPPARITCYTD